MNWLRHLLGIKTEEEIVKEMNGEPTVKKARKALDRAAALLGDADLILDDYEQLEATRRKA